MYSPEKSSSRHGSTRWYPRSIFKFYRKVAAGLLVLALFGIMPADAEAGLGHHHSCALTTSGGVKCWGNNGNGQLGDGTLTDRTTPVDVLASPGVPLSGVAQISVGYLHTCALTTSGGAKCWGRNDYGQLGDGTSTDRTTRIGRRGLEFGRSGRPTRGICEHPGGGHGRRYDEHQRCCPVHHHRRGKQLDAYASDASAPTQREKHHHFRQHCDGEQTAG